MALFITLGYGDEQGYARTDPALRDAAHAHDARLMAEGALIGRAGRPVLVRNPGATGLQRSDGPFMHSTLPLAGFAVIEAADLAAAVERVSQTPCAIAHGVVEVWPLEQAG